MTALFSITSFMSQIKNKIIHFVRKNNSNNSTEKKMEIFIFTHLYARKLQNMCSEFAQITIKKIHITKSVQKSYKHKY